MLSQFLRDMDAIGIKFHFYSGNYLKKKTEGGGILTILIGIFAIYLIAIYSKNIITRKNPSVTISLENTLKYEFIDLNKENIFFGFRIEDYDGNYINESDILYFKIYYYTTEEDNEGQYRKIINDEYLSYHICNDSDFQKVNLSKSFGQLYCPDLGGKKFGGYWDSPNLYYFEIQVFFCENGAQYSSNNSKCTSINKLREFLNQDNPKFFAFYYPLVEFNPLSYEEPINIRYKNNYYCLSHRLQRNDDIFLKKTILNDDKGWLFDDDSNSSFWGIDKIKSTYAYFSDEDLTTEGSSTKIYEINLYTSMEKNYYTRYYMKIQNVIAIVGSLFNLLKYFCITISSIIGYNIQKMEILQNWFFFEEKKKRNLILFNKNKNHNHNHNQNQTNIQESNITKIRNESPPPKIISNKISGRNNPSFFELSTYDVENKINLTKNKQTKYPSSNNLSIQFPGILNNQFTSINNYIHYNSNTQFLNTLKNSNNKTYIEQSGIQLLNRNKINIETENENLNIYKEDINLKYFICDNIKMKFQCFCCAFNKKKFPKYLNYNLLNHYYIHLIQYQRYLELVKHFEFIKKLLLNEGQTKSLLFIKKIDFNNEEEKESLLSCKNNENENSVVNYFNDQFKNSNFSKIDFFLLDNLSENIRKKMLCN